VTITTKRFDVPGGPTLAYDETGDASAMPVVLLHGLSSGREDWTLFGITAKLATEHHVFVLDQRGHGDSDRAPCEYRWTAFADDLVAFLHGVVGQPAALVGHSFGGMVAAHVAGTRPDLVTRAFFEDPPLYWSEDRFQRLVPTGGPPQFAMLGQLLRDLHARNGTVDELSDLMAPLLADFATAAAQDRIRDDGLRVWASVWFRFDPEAIRFDSASRAGYDRTRSIPCPIHLLRGDPARGASFPAGHEEPFLATHPHATAELVEGCGHAIHANEPERFLTSLLAFLAAQ